MPLAGMASAMHADGAHGPRMRHVVDPSYVDNSAHGQHVKAMAFVPVLSVDPDDEDAAKRKAAALAASGGKPPQRLQTDADLERDGMILLAEEEGTVVKVYSPQGEFFESLEQVAGAADSALVDKGIQGGAKRAIVLDFTYIAERRLVVFSSSDLTISMVTVIEKKKIQFQPVIRITIFLVGLRRTRGFSTQRG